MTSLAGTDSVSVTVRNGLAVYASGAGAPVLLLPSPHACTQSPEVCKPLARVLVELGRRVVSFDPPGAFRSTRPADVGMPEMLACAEEALDVAPAPPPVDVCGHSMAAVCALGLALERPALVRRLLLVGVTTGARPAIRHGGMPRCWPPWAPAFWRFCWRAGRLAVGAGNLAVQKRLCAQTVDASSFRPGPGGEFPLEPGDRRRPASPRGRWAARVRDLDYEPRLREVAAPTLVCAGRHDPQTTLSANQAVAAGIPGCRLAVFDESGHYPFVEEPDRFRRAVAGHLSPT